MSEATATIIEDLEQLPVPVRLEIIDKLWDTIPPGEVPISTDLLEEYDRRAQECIDNPEGTWPWSEVESRIKKQLTSK